MPSIKIYLIWIPQIMRIAHIILAHKNPDQVLRMVRNLSHPSFDCWIHVDSKSNADSFNELFLLDNLYRVKKTVRMLWAGFSIVQGMINSMKEVMNSGKYYDYINFLSGQDYPIQPADTLYDYFDANHGCQFIGNRPMEESRENIDRIKKYYLN